MTPYEKWKKIQYYAIIAVISLIALFFLPMIGSEAGLQWNIPTTFVGWVVYVVSKLLVATINILIFHCFVQQGKVNIQKNEKYIEANSILVNVKLKEDIPRSPSEYNRTVYGKKSITIFVTTVLSAVGLTQAVLTFDWISMLTYFFTILMGLVFGVIQMNDTELYWTEEYWRYAKKVEKDLEEAERNSAEQEHASGSCDCGDCVLDSSVVDSTAGADCGSLVVHSDDSSDNILVSSTDACGGFTDLTNNSGEQNPETIKATGCA